MPGALITDGQSRAAVAGVRALGRAGVAVRVLSARRWAPAAWSHHAEASHRGPSSADGRAFASRVAELAERHGPLVVYPGQEQSVGGLARHADLLGERAILPYPGPRLMLALSDKAVVGPLAAAAGLAPPATLAAGTARALAADPPPAPCVVKTPEISDALPATRVCETASELASLLAALPADEELIVQERAAGALEALSLVLDRDGAVAACFASRAQRLSPATAGASSLAISVAADPVIVERAAGMLRDFGWWGLAHLQFLRAGGGPALIDVNVRFYGSLPLATAAGVNLPAIWHRVATGGPSVPPPRYRLGVRYRWLEGELAMALTGEPRRLLTGPARRTAGAMWDHRDPLPSSLLAAQAVAPFARGGVRRVLSRLSARSSLG